MKKSVPLRVDDTTDFTRALSRQLRPTSPSHLSLMNMVARAAGFENFQHMRAATTASRRPERVADDAPVDVRSVERALRRFDLEGRLQTWPTKRNVQTLALWGIWARLPAGVVLQEKDINRLLNAEHSFEDPATLRRTMIACGMLTREKDGSDYLRLEQEPPLDARVVIRSLSERRRTRKSVA
ncbi:MAG: DUF2087 domain-containing protein [Pseudomonadota bacterium]